jgi:hypothetical protein
MPVEPYESRIGDLPVDSTGAPVITECPATGCEDLDLWSMQGAGGQTTVVICGSGHLAFITAKEED